jgi:NitT/TauT family transport system substrate-binding protein
MKLWRRRDSHGLTSATRTARLLVAAVAVSFSLAACGSDDPATPPSEEPATTGGETGGGETGGETGGEVELTHVTLILDYLMDGNKAPFALGKEKGFFSDRGIDLEIVEGTGSADAVKFVANGRFDFGLAASPATAQAIAAGVPVVQVGVHQPRPQDVILVHADSGIDELTDLEGGSIVTAQSSDSETFLRPVLENAGVDVSQVEIVPVDINAADRVWLEREYDALANPFEATIAMKEAVPDLEFTAFWYSDYGFSVMNQGLVVGRDRASEDPELVAAMVEAYAESYLYAAANPDELVETVAGVYDTVDPDVLRAEFELALALVSTPNTEGHPFGYMAPEDWTIMMDLLASTGAVETDMTPEEFYTNEFIGEWDSLSAVEPS